MLQRRNTNNMWAKQVPLFIGGLNHDLPWVDAYRLDKKRAERIATRLMQKGIKRQELFSALGPWLRYFWQKSYDANKS